MSEPCRRVMLRANRFAALEDTGSEQRSLLLAQRLRQLGWPPLVPSAHAHVCEPTRDGANANATGKGQSRPSMLDTARRLSKNERNGCAPDLPGRALNPRFDALRQGLRLVRETRPRVIWGTCSIAAVPVDGAESHRRLGLP